MQAGTPMTGLFLGSLVGGVIWLCTWLVVMVLL